jgi:hypothetical protein
MFRLQQEPPLLILLELAPLSVNPTQLQELLLLLPSLTPG